MALLNRSAQRLSASKVLSLSIRSQVPSLFICAQRLSASKVLSLWPVGRNPVLSKVLNAFRHQRFFHSRSNTSPQLQVQCSTPFGIKGSFTELGGFVRPSSCSCSTPFGIKGSFTLIDTARQFAQKLCSTPFGIKGSFTASGTSGSTCDGECSTPFGIKGSFTAETMSLDLGGNGAQRLSASKVLSRAFESLLLRGKPVLNAFRHQRFFH